LSSEVFICVSEPGDNVFRWGEPDVDGALCEAVDPPLAPWFMPVPCAKANPVPAISAAAAVDKRKCLVIDVSSSDEIALQTTAR
jgi:hypothetical protein